MKIYQNNKEPQGILEIKAIDININVITPKDRDDIQNKSKNVQVWSSQSITDSDGSWLMVDGDELFEATPENESYKQDNSDYSTIFKISNPN